MYLASINTVQFNTDNKRGGMASQVLGALLLQQRNFVGKISFLSRDDIVCALGSKEIRREAHPVTGPFVALKAIIGIAVNAGGVR